MFNLFSKPKKSADTRMTRPIGTPLSSNPMRLNEVANRINNLDMTVFRSPAEYMEAKGYIGTKEILELMDYFRRRNTMHLKDTVKFELTAYKKGMITEDQLVDTIRNYRHKEILLPEQIAPMEIAFNEFSLEFYAKNCFFEVADQDMPTFVVAYESDYLVSVLKKNYSAYRVFYTAPVFIYNKLRDVDIASAI